MAPRLGVSAIVCALAITIKAQSGSKLGIFYREANHKLGVDVRFGEKKHLHTTKILSETEGMFFYDCGKLLERKFSKLLERKFRGGSGSSRGSDGFLNFREESLSIPLEGVLPENFQLCNRTMKEKLVSDILELARDAAQKLEQSQATHPPPELSPQAIQSVDACLATVEEGIGRQRADEDGRPLELLDASTLEEHSLMTDEGVGLCCPTDEIDDDFEDWLSMLINSPDP